MFENMFEKYIKNFGELTIVDLKKKLQSYEIEVSNDMLKEEILKLLIKSFLKDFSIAELQKISKCYKITTNSKVSKSQLVRLLIDPVTKSSIIGTIPKCNYDDSPNVIIEKEKNNISEKTKISIDGVSKDVDLSSDNQFAINTLHSQKNLKKHLQDLLYLENEIQFLKEHLITLQIHSTVNEKKFKKIYKSLKESLLPRLKTYNLEGEVEILQDKIKNPQNYIKSIIDKNAIKIDEPTPPNFLKPTPPILPKLTTLMKPVKPAEPIYKTPSFFNKKKIEIYNTELKQKYAELLKLYGEKINQYEANLNQNNILQKKYEDDMAMYQKDLAEYEMVQYNYQNSLKEYKEAYDKAYDKLLCAHQKEFIKTCKNELSVKKKELENIEEQASVTWHIEFEEIIANLPETLIKNFLTNEINLAKKELKETVKIRNKLYAYNIIYGKYRNIVALSTIYEYIDSGRCETLEGSNGAYNLFETELRSNLIISNLHSINVSLEQIKENQFLLYKELKEVNKELKKVDHSVQNVIIAIKKTNSSLEKIENSLYSIFDNTNEIKENTTTIMNDVSDIEKHSKEIVDNTAITAYNSAITAHYSKLTAKIESTLL